jgi:methane monooxygenase PmoA-like
VLSVTSVIRRPAKGELTVTRLHKTSCAIAALVVALLAQGAVQAQPQRVQLVVNEVGRRVDVLIDGKPFTSYIWPTTLKKPTLFPLRSANGVLVTRGYPLEPRKNERVDHPHHVGLWMNSGDVNGLDFWNNSDAIKPEQQPKMGTIFHRKIVSANGGTDKGTLVVETEWVKPDSNPLVKEHTTFVFRGDAKSRTIDRTTTLTALGERVVFKDNKEAFYGMRVARELELPYDKAEVLTDASGKPTPKPIIDNTGVSGQYTSSEGRTGDDVWGQRARWMMLTGTVQNEPVTIAMFDNPANPNYPAFWHARGYGLFAINPLGEKVLPGGGKRDFDLTLEPGKSVTFTYRVTILNGTAKPEEVEKAYQQFVPQKATAAR